MLTDLHGRRAVVTGASRGIGRAIAVRLAEAGADVVVTARSAEALADVAREIESKGCRCIVVAVDVTADGAASAIVQAAVEGLGGLDILVNNAGGNSFSVPLSAMRQSGWQKTLRLNLDASVELLQAALPSLVASGHGSAINVSSVLGLRGAPMMSHYGAAKAAIISVTQSVAIEMAPQGVRVNALVPGWIETDLTEFLRADDDVEVDLLADVPMGRWGTSAEIADRRASCRERV
jgi:NAD(P)-dependent dehydrogenase (short-subunit alcohol dehydrogenase family)